MYRLISSDFGTQFKTWKGMQNCYVFRKPGFLINNYNSYWVRYEGAPLDKVETIWKSKRVMVEIDHNEFKSLWYSDNKSWRDRGEVPFYSACQLVNMKGMRKFRGKTSFATTTVVLDIRQKPSMNSQTFLENRVFTMKTLSHKVIINHKGGKNAFPRGKNTFPVERLIYPPYVLTQGPRCSVMASTCVVFLPWCLLSKWNKVYGRWC